MAMLTADDVLNKKFQATKFREGYDQDEVDDFLDEVVNTLRVVTAESDELKGKLAAAERRIAELRVFERDYRTRLKSYLENLLGDLESRGSNVQPRPAGDSGLSFDA